MESEFFGYKKGSFTGATQDKGGLFQAAQGGTLFLDEVADLPMHDASQAAARDPGAGGAGGRCAGRDRHRCADTQRQPQKSGGAGAGWRFPPGLFYRLNVIEMRLPSLREHPDDIPELVRRFSTGLSRQRERRNRGDAVGAAALQRYAFPGNIRELENILERSFTLMRGRRDPGPRICCCRRTAMEPSIAPAATRLSLDPDPGSNRFRPPPRRVASSSPRTVPILQPPSGNLEGYLEEIEKAAILRALEATRYNKTAAAEKLGITFPGAALPAEKAGNGVKQDGRKRERWLYVYLLLEFQSRVGSIHGVAGHGLRGVVVSGFAAHETTAP
jgi:two-component system response regulator PilR (NtrC family)